MHSPEGVELYLNMFENDARLTRDVRCIRDCDTLQGDLDRLQRCSDASLMKFNSNRCKVMKMEGGHKTSPGNAYHVTGNKQEDSTSVDLGINKIFYLI